MESEYVTQAPGDPWFEILREVVVVPDGETNRPITTQPKAKDTLRHRGVEAILERAMKGDNLRRVGKGLPVLLRHTIGDAGNGRCVVVVYGKEVGLIEEDIRP